MKRLTHSHIVVRHAPGYRDDGVTFVRNEPIPDPPYEAVMQDSAWWALPEDERPAPTAWETYHAVQYDDDDLSPWVEYKVVPIKSDPYAYRVGGITVHDFDGDPSFAEDDGAHGWGYYLIGDPCGDGWTTGFKSMQDAARAARREVASWGVQS